MFRLRVILLVYGNSFWRHQTKAPTPIKLNPPWFPAKVPMRLPPNVVNAADFGWLPMNVDPE